MIRWIWDDRKAARNQRDHGVSFALAARVMGDPLASSRPDPHPDGDRWQTIGMPSATSSVVMFVVHTGPEADAAGAETGRIISARLTEPWERRAYEEGEF